MQFYLHIFPNCIFCLYTNTTLQDAGNGINGEKKNQPTELLSTSKRPATSECPPYISFFLYIYTFTCTVIF